jgi:hypothetical protein
VTKTVDGMCADCWGVKDPARAKRWLRFRRRERLLGLYWDDPLDLLWALGAVVLAVLVAVYLVGRWI